MWPLKLIDIDGFVGTIFPQEVLDKFNLEPGDEFDVAITSYGVILIPKCCDVKRSE